MYSYISSLSLSFSPNRVSDSMCAQFPPDFVLAICLSLSLYTYTYIYVYISLYVSIYLSVCLSISLSPPLSLYLLLWVSFSCCVYLLDAILGSWHCLPPPNPPRVKRGNCAFASVFFYMCILSLESVCLLSRWRQQLPCLFCPGSGIFCPDSPKHGQSFIYGGPLGILL